MGFNLSSNLPLKIINNSYMKPEQSATGCKGTVAHPELTWAERDGERKMVVV